MPHDILVFYCGLAPFPPGDISRLFAIGYLRMKAVHRVSARDLETRRKLQHRFGNTAHFVRRVPDRELVLVEGYRTRSRFFRRALPLGDSRDNLLRDLFPLRYQGSIRRAVGHWVRGKAAMEFLESWLRNGPAMLVEPRTRLFLVPFSAVGLTSRRGDLTIVVRNNCVAPGDGTGGGERTFRSSAVGFPGGISSAEKERADPGLPWREQSRDHWPAEILKALQVDQYHVLRSANPSHKSIS